MGSLSVKHALVPTKLCNEGLIWMNPAALLHVCERIAHSPAVLAHQESDDKSGTAADALLAVHEHSATHAIPQCRRDKVGRSLKVRGEVGRECVFDWNTKVSH
jgi:predicted RNA-binding Zn-ribbon protein involved in translation (DUF1610 family)